MRVAILSDIHGNSFALNEVLKALPSDIKTLWILGDLVGYYYDIKSVMDSLATYNCVFIRGNHEEYLRLSAADSEFSLSYQTKYGSSLKLAATSLAADEIKTLVELPLTVSIDDNILLAHGTPWSCEKYVYPDANSELLEKFTNYKESIFFLGHTHYPMDISYKNKRMINPGSVGQQRNGVLGAHWAILELENHQVEFKVTPYDITLLEKEILRLDPFNTYLSSILRRKK